MFFHLIFYFLLFFWKENSKVKQTLQYYITRSSRNTNPEETNQSGKELKVKLPGKKTEVIFENTLKEQNETTIQKIIERTVTESNMKHSLKVLVIQINTAQ